MIVGVSERVIKNHVGGNSRYARELYRGLSALGVEHQPLAAGAINVPAAPGVRYLLAEMAWPFLVGGGDLDLVHYPADTGPVRAGSIPLVTTIHGMASLHVDGVRSPLAERAWRFRTRRAAASSDHVITVSRSSADDLVRALGLPADRISVIPHGIDHERFHPDPTADVPLLEGLDLPARFCLYLGNLDPRKNIIRLVRAFESPVLRRADAHLVIAGGAAWGADEILRAIERADRVTYLGPVAEELVAPLMRAADVFAFPSLYEGFGFPVLEAMACGTPVVCSDRGSLAEVAGDAAQVVDPLDVDDVAEGVAAVWTDPSLVLDLVSAGTGNAGRYTWEASAEAHRRCFESVVSRR